MKIFKYIGTFFLVLVIFFFFAQASQVKAATNSNTFTFSSPDGFCTATVVASLDSFTYPPGGQIQATGTISVICEGGVSYSDASVGATDTYNGTPEPVPATFTAPTSGGSYSIYFTATFDECNKGVCSSPTNGNTVGYTVTSNNPTVTVTATPSTIDSGGTSNISWTSGNGATFCDSTGGGGSGTTGSFTTPQLTTNTTYSVTCFSSTGNATGSATVTIAAAPTESSYWNVNNLKTVTINSGTNTRLDWTTTGFDSNGICNVYEGSIEYPYNGETNFPATGNSTYVYTPIETNSDTFTVKCYESYSPNTTYSDPVNTLTVSSQSLPDLTAGAITPPTATTNVPVNLSALIINQGSVSTEAGFTNLFQLSPDNGVTVTNIPPPVSMPTLGADSSSITTYDGYTFTTAGTYYVRACANMTIGTNGYATIGNIVESNYNNNCGAWTPIVVSDTPPPPSLPDLTAGMVSPSTAIVNTPVNLSAIITNQGTASTGTGFYNFFQVSTTSPGSGTGNNNNNQSSLFSFNTALAASSGGSNYGDQSPVWMSTLGPGASAIATDPYTFTTAGTYYVRACANMTSSGVFGSVVESNYNNNCSPAWTTVTVTNSNVPLPDLTAGAVTPTTATINIPTTFSSTISNIGDASTGISFPNFFQVSTDDGVTATDLTPPIWLPPLGPGNSAPVTITYTPTTAGTFYGRACANKTNSATFGGVIESNYNNNCGSWTPITVSGVTQMCTDPKAVNYGLPLPCIYQNGMCLDPTANNYGQPLPCTYSTGTIVTTCEDTTALNYGLPLPCIYNPGDCLNPKAKNYGGSLPCILPKVPKYKEN